MGPACRLSSSKKIPAIAPGPISCKNYFVQHNNYIFAAVVSTGFAMVSAGTVLVSVDGGVTTGLSILVVSLVSLLLPELLQATTETAMIAIAKNFFIVLVLYVKFYDRFRQASAIKVRKGNRPCQITKLFFLFFPAKN